MESILKQELREQAGTESYNRYEYQMSWAVYHMLKKYKNNEKFIIFCEYHDDVAESGFCSSPYCMEFFQIKTTKKGNFTLDKLTYKPAKKQHSFLGYLFFNFLKFGSSCEKCHFVGNKDFDEDIKNWQTVVQDNNSLKKKNKALYDKVKNKIKYEYKNSPEGLPTNFDDIFDRFIQNTFITKSELPLETHDNYIRAEFFDALKFKTIETNTAHLIFETIINEVRKKARSKINPPISFKELSNKKGISSDIFNSIESFKKDLSRNIIGDIEDFLKSEGYSLPKIRLFIRTYKEHIKRQLDVSNTLYNDLIISYKILCNNFINNNNDIIDNFQLLNQQISIEIYQFLKENEHPYINKNLLEVLFYETLLSTED
ncbi:dsDNA nuclease domain-containing protein [Schinkia azotoformans]|uniref:dsDNA nuclease domain-containing protein n=1 Tax=Schinkia azotoformans TaxID=1454 RepID=UPI002DB8F879|nr:dsDNA nuclease domain-containing protein [Schinkia azotoformans]MEC1744164.1 dsDNA nuclease domain-containing protein [Schinkia azotoformans]